MKKLDSVKSFIVKNRAVIAVGIVVTATIATVAIDVVMHRNDPDYPEALLENAK
jgi:hypothetical protein